MVTPAPALDIDTPHGLARAHVHAAADRPHGALVLGHGAGGSVTAPDLQAVTATASASGVTVVLVEQPYRVAGRRSAAPAGQLDTGWTAVLEHLRHGPLAGLPVVTGGRSSGARVACRTAQVTGAVGVLCLAFPLHPPRRNPDAVLKTRLPELQAVTVPVLIVQGETDRFGMPPAAPGRTVVPVAGDHRLAKDLPAVTAAVAAWLPGVLSG
ncbi:MAG: alpha/beta hydrolase [Solirubrobacterales bacterium]|nr:alpha/beta hydrolase [Solirubrobacterales bacterium]